MTSKAADRIKALQERAAALAAQTPVSPDSAQAAVDAQHAIMAASAHFGGTLDQLVQDRAIQSIPITQIAPETRPDSQQPRFLPLPEQLIVQGQPAADYYELVDELKALGESLKARQIQPIVIFAGMNDTYPAARYLILVGQRRWTAAHLVGLETLDAVIVDPPTPAERVLIQYAENEEREEFSDMERAWSLHQMKHVLHDAPWEEVEEHLHMSRARRQQLLRLMAFTPTQQRLVALLRLQETQARTLHSALRAGDLSAAQVDEILDRLRKIASERAESLLDDATGESAKANSLSRRTGIDGPTVARLVARVRRSTESGQQSQRTPRWLPTLRDQVTRTSQGLQRSLDRVEGLHDTDAAALRDDVLQLQQLSQRILERIDRDEQH